MRVKRVIEPGNVRTDPLLDRMYGISLWYRAPWHQEPGIQLAGLLRKHPGRLRVTVDLQTPRLRRATCAWREKLAKSSGRRSVVQSLRDHLGKGQRLFATYR